MYFYLSSKLFNIYYIRCFGNSVEAMFYMVAFNYFYEINSKFDRNIIIFTLIMIVSFMMRCTSIIGFILPCLYKIICANALKPFLISAAVVACPSLFLLAMLDSYCYGKATFVPFNFLKENIIDKVSEQFGVSPFMEYINSDIPTLMHLLTPLFWMSVAYACLKAYNK
jgi:hypothetical protein